MADPEVTRGLAQPPSDVDAHDPLVTLARRVWYLGVVTMPWIGLRAGAWTWSDLILIIDVALVALFVVVLPRPKPTPQIAWPVAAWIGLAVGAFYAASNTEGYASENLMIGLRL